MFARVVLISAIVSFVYVPSIESCESETLSPLEIPHLDTDMNTRSTKTIVHNLESNAEEENQPAVRTLVPADKPIVSPQSTDKPITIHELVHSAMKQPKKRATNYKVDRKAAVRPGCCG